ncbi:RNA polymerase II elongation factor ELL3 [Heracleum sosnowskyi]|uniref:RNA polymerase II elongation factor ELL3 n=1 Tax=Heracleum sosnowskyi TaxID=360622 RepID=A0AAD8J953_9APIA|nr:RNA polymerase II elongation factor ELL3 [Heracleum sosnowskyi]
MADQKNAHHVVEIPVDEEHQQKLVSAMTTISAMQNHPLMEISQSPGHLLLLKLWQREEDLFGRKIARKESRLDSIRSEIFQLCCFFFLFHGFFLTILSASVTYVKNVNEEHEHVCHKWYWKVSKQLQRERTDNRSLTRCVQELRMKGASFDLSKEPLNAKRMKSSSVEIKWKPLTWCSQSLTTICLLCLTGLLFPASRFILCV